ncbi:UDP-GalNAc:beta-1,3-N-acetylgalactosaminyltransferase 2 isoform X1 [Bemisia tabaci]|uniref:UDP-GalNAc:beta-1, 3-N-acetylgalactosaminyltransferase 2 isoform X1 n=1 Tax=Bemisia tabaci TaxID=7038 RepID=UPI003B2870BF
MILRKIFIVSLFLLHFLDRHFDRIFPSKYSLVIGIISAQEHLDRRNAARKTWLKSLTQSKQVKYYFVIGKHSCPVPTEDRLFIEECSEWSSKFFNSSTSWEDHFSVGATNKDLGSSFNHNTVSQQASEFIFIVNFDIVILQVGVVSEVIKNNGGLVYIKIYDQRNSVLLATTFTNTSFSADEYLSSAKVNQLFLPKGFEGRIRIEGSNQILILDSASCSHAKTNQIPPVVHILHPVSNQPCFLVGFKYVLHDASKFKEFMRKRQYRFAERQNQIIRLQDSLDEEFSIFQDIILLDVIDVYKNLPLKVLTFFHWMAKNIAFDYALKTDDDTIINIDKVLAEVEDSIRNKRTWDWWSCFRSMWPVMDIGKWREYNLISQTYPEFPSGAGYVLRRNLIEYLSRNFDLMFKHFQGEDVSMGIWMSPIFPVKLVGRSCHWACDNEFRSYSCNVANLDVTKFSNYWKLLKKS